MMRDTQPFPTVYPDINRLLYRLLHDVRAALPQQFVGLYVHGSVASGTFEPRRSDIDFLVVTGSDLPETTLTALAAMHAALTASGLPWADVLEGSYIPAAALRRYDPAHADHPALRADGSFAVDHHASDWIIQRHVIRETGIALAGPLPTRLIDPVSPDALRQAARGILREWWLPQLTDHSRLISSEYQAYAILTMCRSLYTLREGAVIPKPQAAQWAQAVLGPPWAALIERALRWGHGDALDALDATLELIRYTLAQSDTLA
jgi:predicted nucleotidyltransferase